MQGSQERNVVVGDNSVAEHLTSDARVLCPVMFELCISLYMFIPHIPTTVD